MPAALLPRCALGCVRGERHSVVPYLCYARKDRKTKPRDPVTTRFVAALFEAVGVDRVVTLDVHDLAAFQNSFRCRTDHLLALPLFVEHFAPLARTAPVAVVSPDIGGAKRARQFADAQERALGREVATAFVEKHRSGGVVSGGAFAGDARPCSPKRSAASTGADRSRNWSRSDRSAQSSGAARSAPAPGRFAQYGLAPNDDTLWRA